LANPRITVLGEVQQPGMHYLYNEQNSMLDAIGLAGDFTDFSNRRKVKVIRRTGDGTTKTAYINMNRSDFLNTEFQYAQPHDIIYVEPKKAKSFDSSAKSVGVVISAVSLAALFANLIIDFTRRN
jgi:polysaccharide export outer membrane protein